MAKIWSKFRNSSEKEKFALWLQWAHLKEKGYQFNAFEWCASCEMDSEHRGGILADEMGLGKTIVMIGHIFCHSVKRTLIVLPNALLSQWNSCLENYIMSLPYRWLMSKEYYIYHGANDISLEELLKKRLVVTTYGTMVSRLKTLKEIPWNRIVFDEAHHLREMNTHIFKAALALKTDIHWFMTGTPIQNRVRDIHALCRLLGFVGYRGEEKLQEILRMKMLRRTKKDVGICLPPLKEYIKRVPWDTEEEEALSAQIHTRTIFPQGAMGALQLRIPIGHLAAFIRSRQMCIYPKTIQYAIESGKTIDFLEDVHPLWHKITASKINYVTRKLIRRSANGRRKLVFCHYRHEIDELQRRLQAADIAVGVVDGRTPAKMRKTLLEPSTSITKKLWNECLPCLHTETKIPIYDMVSDYLAAEEVLLVQIQTSSEGLNLQDFSEVYFTSPHWNPALEDQAIARCHRIGQKRVVKVFRFIMERHDGEGMTLDEYCSHTQTGKRQIFNTMFG